jgi:hypothetical protein
MKKIIFLTCLTLLFGCSKNLQDEPEMNEPDVKKDVSINLANAFADATNIVENGLKSSSSDSIVTNPSDIESNMIVYLSAVYGTEIKQFYYENKDDFTPDLSNYENLPDLSIDDLDENNPQEFVENIFAATKSNLKSAGLYKSASLVMQTNVDNFINEIENTVQSFMIESIESESFDEYKLKDDLLTKIQGYRENINWQTLSTDEQDRLLTALSTVENSIGNFIDFSSSYPTANTEILALNLKSTQGWLKNLIKSVAKVVVMAVCLVGGTVGGVVLGGTITGSNPYGMIAGGIAGFVGGAYATSKINSWIDRW